MLNRKEKETTLKIHLGVHKTATTYLQNIIYQEAKKAENLNFYSTNELRPHFINFIKSKVPFFDMKNLISIKKKHTIISDENILGSTYHLKIGTLYKDIDSRLKKLKRIASLSDDFVIYIVIRNYNDFISSMYFESLRHSNFIPFKEYTKNIENEDICWVRLTGKLKSKFGEDKVIIKKYENLDVDLFAEELLGKKIVSNLDNEKIDHHVSRSSLSENQNKLLEDCFSIYGKEITTKFFRLIDGIKGENDNSKKCQHIFDLSLNDKYVQDCKKLGIF